MGKDHPTEFDLHEIFTKYFNPVLNEFIARYGEQRQIGTVRTGGSYEFKITQQKFFGRWARELESLRKNTTITAEKVKLKELKEIIEPLYGVYLDAVSKNKLTQELETELEINLLTPVWKFFKKLDKITGEDYFYKRAREIQNTNVIVDAEIFYAIFRGGKTAIKPEEAKEGTQRDSSISRPWDTFIQEGYIEMNQQIAKETSDSSDIQNAYEHARKRKIIEKIIVTILILAIILLVIGVFTFVK